MYTVNWYGVICNDIVWLWYWLLEPQFFNTPKGLKIIIIVVVENFHLDTRIEPIHYICKSQHFNIMPPNPQISLYIWIMLIYIHFSAKTGLVPNPWTYKNETFLWIVLPRGALMFWPWRELNWLSGCIFNWLVSSISTVYGFHIIHGIDPVLDYVYPQKHRTHQPTNPEASLGQLGFFLLCGSKFFIGDHIKKTWSKSDHFERSYQVLKTKFSKISAKMDTFLIFEEKSHSWDNKKILHSFFACQLRFFYCVTQSFFYWGSYKIN